jgi:hypothetical protein
MPHLRTLLLTVLTGGLITAAQSAVAQTTLTMSSWVSLWHRVRGAAGV